MGRMKNNNKAIAWGIFILFISFSIYMLVRFLPGWLCYWSHETAKAEITSIDKIEKGHVINFEYYNVYKEDVIKLSRKVYKKSQYDIFNNNNTISVKYNKYYVNKIYFTGIDNEPSFYFTLITYLIILFVTIQSIRVLRGRITIEQMFGFGENDENE